jgi:hypothetical protein
MTDAVASHKHLASRESEDPVALVPKTLDSRFRGNDD